MKSVQQKKMGQSKKMSTFCKRQVFFTLSFHRIGAERGKQNEIWPIFSFRHTGGNIKHKPQIQVNKGFQLSALFLNSVRSASRNLLKVGMWVWKKKVWKKKKPVMCWYFLVLTLLSLLQNCHINKRLYHLLVYQKTSWISYVRLAALEMS